MNQREINKQYNRLINHYKGLKLAKKETIKKFNRLNKYVTNIQNKLQLVNINYDDQLFNLNQLDKQNIRIAIMPYNTNKTNKNYTKLISAYQNIELQHANIAKQYEKLQAYSSKLQKLLHENFIPYSRIEGYKVIEHTFKMV